MFRKGIITVLVAAILCVFMTMPSFAALFELKVTFDDDDEEASIRENMDLLDVFEIAQGLPEADAIVKVEGDNKFIETKSYLDICTWDYIDAPYTFSIDYRLVQENDNIGFFVRGVYPSSYSKVNPMNHGVDQKFAYFEWDWYGENGGADGSSGIGGSGILVTPKNSELLLRIKNWKPDGLNISSDRISLPLPEGTDNSVFNRITFKDDGSKVEIYFNDTLMATIEFSEKGVYEEDQEDDNEYFKKAVVKDAEGNEIHSMDNAKINALGSQVAIGNRNLSIQLDNLYLSYEVPDPTPTPVPTDTPEPKDTEAPSTTPTSTDKKTDEEKGVNILPFAIAGGAIVVIAAAAIVILIMKKKN